MKRSKVISCSQSLIDGSHNDRYNKNIEEEIKALPKIDLHRHLTGSVRFKTILDILREFKLEAPFDNNRKTPLRDDIVQLKKFIQIKEPLANQARFIDRVWGVLNKLIVNEEVVSRLTYEAIEDASQDNIIYVEFRVSPYGKMNGNGSQKRTFSFPDFLKALRNGIDKARYEYPNTIAKIVLSIPRHTVFRRLRDFADIKRLQKFADDIISPCLDYKNSYVVGFDLSGKVEGYSSWHQRNVKWPPCLYRPIFKRIKESHFGVTIHAGENDSADSIREAVEFLGADRIGHGIKAKEDPLILDFLRENKIPLEICPTSNIRLGLTSSLANHPIREYYDLGLCTTINTDDPAVFDITLSSECLDLVKNENIHFTLHELKCNISNSLYAAFASNDEKQRLQENLYI